VQIDLSQPAVVFSNMLTIWWMYVAHRLIGVARGLIQTACTSLGVFFSSVGLTISSSKSEVMLFSRKHERPPILIRIGSHVLPQAMTFKYLGVFFDCALRWSAQTKYVERRCLKRINLLKSVAGVSWGAHPSCMLLLYRGLIGSVLEYGSVCYARMARTHMLLLERIQYRGLRISMSLMGSTPNNSLGVLSGIPPLRHRLFYLNFSYLVITFQKNGHPLHDRLQKLYDQSPQKCLIPFHEVSGLDIQPEVGYTRHELGAILSTPKVNRHMEVALSGVHADMYPIVAPLELKGIALFSTSNLFYTDGSLMDGVAGFAVRHSVDCTGTCWNCGK
jgi:hypothetical protein